MAFIGLSFIVIYPISIFSLLSNGIATILSPLRSEIKIPDDIVYPSSPISRFIMLFADGHRLAEVFGDWTLGGFDFGEYFYSHNFIPVFFVTVACGIMSGLRCRYLHSLSEF